MFRNTVGPIILEFQLEMPSFGGTRKFFSNQSRAQKLERVLIGS